MNEARKEQIEKVAKTFVGLDTPKKNFIAGFIACSMMSDKDNNKNQSQFDVIEQINKLQPHM